MLYFNCYTLGMIFRDIKKLYSVLDTVGSTPKESIDEDKLVVDNT